jgi:threonylcarbamoyladenosine tRNA methylthiotransferase MtaB
MRIAFLTLGCRTNQAESARIEQILNAAGHQTVDSAIDAEICIINTCSVTAKADYQSRQLISRALKTNAEVFVTGCYAELNSAFIKEKKSTVRVINNRDKNSIINMISHNISPFTLIKSQNERHRPVIKVQDGCNNNCSYCIIPRARGSSTSIRPEEVLEEVMRYESIGFEEIVISGIHLGMYGKDLNPSCNLTKLLETILVKSSIRRIRLSSIEINEISDDLLDIIDDNRICKHLHIPLQSGDDTILKLMNREYSVADYLKLIEKIIKRFNNIALGTDLIVGFPGESDSLFHNTVRFIESINFAYLHVFPYSLRPGTRAATMHFQVPGPVKRLRVKRMRELSNCKKIAFINNNIGLDHQMVVETVNENVIGGTTSNYIKALLPQNGTLVPGSLVRIRITGIENQDALAVPITDTEPQDK